VPYVATRRDPLGRRWLPPHTIWGGEHNPLRHNVRGTPLLGEFRDAASKSPGDPPPRCSKSEEKGGSTLARGFPKKVNPSQKKNFFSGRLKVHKGCDTPRRETLLWPKTRGFRAWRYRLPKTFGRKGLSGKSKCLMGKQRESAPKIEPSFFRPKFGYKTFFSLYLVKIWKKRWLL